MVVQTVTQQQLGVRCLLHSVYMHELVAGLVLFGTHLAMLFRPVIPLIQQHPCDRSMHLRTNDLLRWLHDRLAAELISLRP